MSQKRTFPGQDFATKVMNQQVEATLVQMAECKPEEREAVLRQALALAYRMGAEDARRAMASAVDAVTDHANAMHRGEA